jgi:hypothetical protein
MTRGGSRRGHSKMGVDPFKSRRHKQDPLVASPLPDTFFPVRGQSAVYRAQFLWNILQSE